MIGASKELQDRIKAMLRNTDIVYSWEGNETVSKEDIDFTYYSTDDSVGQNYPRTPILQVNTLLDWTLAAGWTLSQTTASTCNSGN
mmetsp:Transcript_3088/g.4551  ORF Transcript_3088/g.4551 Transcript_3088/m.4551 type:complete len:86 (-) Transcript_3088:68-325(-)